MRNTARPKLDAARSALEFCRRHPDESEAWIASVARLERALFQAGTVREQQALAELETLRTIAERDALAGRIRERIGQLARLADAAGHQEGIGALHFSVPAARASLGAFLVGARMAVGIASEHRRLLVRYGMTPEFLRALEADVQICVDAQERREYARASAQAAYDDLFTLADEATLALRHLDALHRIRFAEQREVLAEWNTARAVRWASAASPAPETDGQARDVGSARRGLAAGDPSVGPPF